MAECAREEPIAKQEEFHTIQKRYDSLLILKSEQIFDIEEWARAGFFFDALLQLIRCAFCDLRLQIELLVESAFELHVRKSPGCIYISYYTNKAMNGILIKEPILKTVPLKTDAYTVLEFDGWMSTGIVQYALNDCNCDHGLVTKALHTIKSEGNSLSIDTLWDSLLKLELDNPELLNISKCEDNNLTAIRAPSYNHRLLTSALSDNEVNLEADSHKTDDKYLLNKNVNKKSLFKRTFSAPIEKLLTDPLNKTTDNVIQGGDQHVDYDLTENDISFVPSATSLHDDVRPKTKSGSGYMQLDKTKPDRKSFVPQPNHEPRDHPLLSIPTLIEDEVDESCFLFSENESKRKTGDNLDKFLNGLKNQDPSEFGRPSSSRLENDLIFEDCVDSGLMNDSMVNLENSNMKPRELAQFCSLQINPPNQPLAEPRMDVPLKKTRLRKRKETPRQHVITESLKELRRDILDNVGSGQGLKQKHFLGKYWSVEADSPSFLSLCSTLSKDPSLVSKSSAPPRKAHASDSAYESIPQHEDPCGGPAVDLPQREVSKAAAAVPASKGAVSELHEMKRTYCETVPDVKSDVKDDAEDNEEFETLTEANEDEVTELERLSKTIDSLVHPGEELKREYLVLWRQKMCHECWQDHSDTLFLPCRHLITCEGCSEGMDNCPQCEEEIVGTVKVYFT